MMPISSLLQALPALFVTAPQNTKVQETTRPVFAFISSLFSYLAASGYLVACTIALGGFTKLSFVIALLATSTLIGSYVSSYCELQQGLSDNVNRFEKQNERLQSEVDRLEAENTKLEETNQRLSSEVNRFHDENERLSSHIDRLASIQGQLEEQVSSLERANQELHASLSIFRAQNEDYRELIETDRQQRERLIEQNREQTAHYELLLQQLETHFRESQALWETLHAQANEDRTKLVEEFKAQLIKSASLIGRMEELSHVHEEIRKATFQLLHLQQEVLSAQQRVGEAMQTLGKYQGQIEERDLFFKKIKGDLEDLLKQMRAYDRDRFEMLFKKLMGAP